MKKQDQGFTLLELLVVVAVIGLLTALMLPVLGAARSKGNAIQCKSNLRQMALSATTYAAGNNGELPLAYKWDYQAGIRHAWDVTMINGEAQPGLIWEGHGDSKISQCPSFIGKSNRQDGAPYSGYNYNASYLGGYQTVHPSGAIIQSVPSANLYDIINSSTCAMFGEGEYSAGANYLMRSPEAGPLDSGTASSTGGTQGFRHQGKTHIAFVDGHVEALDVGYPVIGASADPELDFGFLSPDNSLYDYE